MPTTNQKSEKECRDLLLQGVKDIAGPVGSTLGPSGKTVVIATHMQGFWMPRVTKDGATVARSINPQDPLRAAGANLAKQVAMETAAEAGDGSTSAMVLLLYLVEYGQKLVEEGENPHHVKKGMEIALEKVCAYLKEKSIPLSGDMVRQVATISANGDESVGKTVAEAYGAIKESGVVVLAQAMGNKTRVESVQGMQLSSGTSPMWFNDAKNLRLVTTQSVVVVTTEMVSTMDEVKPLWDFCKTNGKSLVIFAESVIGEALQTLSIPANRQAVPFCIVPISDLRENNDEILQDIALVTGATLLGRSAGRGLKKSDFNHWGRAERVEAYAGRTVIIGGGGDKEKVELRCEAIRSQINEAGSDSKLVDWHESRLAGIDGGMSCIYIGANTDAEVTELYDRYDDAVRAVKCARKDGVLPGGGATLYQTGKVFYENPKSESESRGEVLLYESLSSPLERICKNACTDDESTSKLYNSVTDIINKGKGYDFRQQKECDLIESGIIDPAIVPITALKKAVSVAGSIITTDHIITNI